jgi:RNA polymerase sigma factor FliA
MAIVKENKETTLWLDFKKNKDALLKQKIIFFYLEQVKSIAASLFAKRPNNNVDFSDYFHYAILGLIESIDLYKYRLNDNFMAYAHHRIRGSVLTGITKMSEKSNFLNYKKKYTQRIDSLSKANNQSDLFDEMVDLSISLTIGYIFENADLHDDIETPYYDNKTLELHETLLQCVEHLTGNEKSVIQYHYFYDIDFKTISEMLDLSASRIAQLHRSGLENIRKIYNKDLNLDVSY